MHERRRLIVISLLETLHRVRHELDPFFYVQEKPIPQGSEAENKRGAYIRSLSFRIQVLRQIIHQMERTSAVDHLVDQIAFAAR